MSVRHSSVIELELNTKKREVADLESEYAAVLKSEETAATPRRKTAEDFNRERDGNFKTPFDYSRK